MSQKAKKATKNITVLKTGTKSRQNSVDVEERIVVESVIVLCG